MSKFSVKKPYTVVVAIVIVLLLGFISFTNMTTDLLPSMDLPYIVVVTAYPGASPEKVERDVTDPLEASLATTNNLEEIRSVSNENYSMIILQFAEDTNMDATMVDLNTTLNQVKGGFDDMVQMPIMMRINPDMMPVMMMTVSAEGMDAKALSDVLEQDLLKELEKVDGVATIGTNGVLTDQVRITISEKKIDEFNDRMTDSLDRTFSSAEAKLNQAQNKLVSSEKKVNGSLATLREKKEFVVSSLDQLNAIFDDQLQELNSQKQDVLDTKTYYESALQLLDQKIDILTKTQTQLTQSLQTWQTIKASTTDLRTSLVSLTAAMEGFDQQIASIRESSMSDAEKEAAIAAITQSDAYQQTTSALTGIDETLKPMGISRNDLLQIDERIQSVKDSLNATDTDLETAKQERNSTQKTYDELKPNMDAALSMIDSYIQTVENERAKQSLQLSEPLKQILSGENQLTTALQKIRSGKKQINSAKSQLSSSKKQAYKQADLSKMITAELVSNLLTAQNFSMPLGSLEGTDGKERIIKVTDTFQSLEELENLALMDLDMDGLETIYLKDVVDIELVSQNEGSYALVNGEPGIILSVSKQSTASTATVCEKLHRAIETLEQDHAGVNIDILMDQGMYIGIVVDSVIQNLLLGGILAVIILFLFLKDIKPTVIIACSIPISLMFALVLMYFTDITLNIISLAGLALGVGMLVDNSIVVIENIYRLRSEGYSPIEASVQGAKEVAGAIIASTLTTVSVFLPIVFATGLARQLFVDMGLTIGYSLIASLIVALTLVPMMASKLLVKPQQQKKNLLDGVLNRYGVWLSKALRHKAVVLLSAFALLVVSGVLAYRSGTSLIPDMESNQMSVSITLPKDSTDDLKTVTRIVMERMEGIEEIETVGAIVSDGSSSSMSLLQGTTSSDSLSLYVVLKTDSKRSNRAIAEDILERTQDVPAEIVCETSGMNMSSYLSSGIGITVEGDDLDDLKQTVTELAAILETVEGVQEIDTGLDEDNQEIRVVVDKNKAISYGLTTAQVYMALFEDMSNETKAGSIRIGQSDVPMVIIDETKEVLTQDALADYRLEGTKDGKKVKVKLSDIADIEMAQSLDSISHTSQQRMMTVSAQIKDGYNIGLVSRELQQKLAGYSPVEGVTYAFDGENEMINETLFELVKMIALAIVFIYLIMVAQFQSLLSPLIVMFTIPLAFTGGFLALWLCGMDISIISMLGFLVLSGIVVNNGIVFVDYTNQLCATGIDCKDALVQAGKTRMRPILMTALTTILGLSTMALGMGMGAEMLQSMGVVTIGGLIYSTLMTLFIVPCMYDLLAGKRKTASNDETIKQQ